uniref:BACK domain-containing protein n=1 Tax=Panagrolaimus davidi TaxID=227884 RepID=A0A914PZJ7_9BILA
MDFKCVREKYAFDISEIDDYQNIKDVIETFEGGEGKLKGAIFDLFKIQPFKNRYEFYNFWKTFCNRILIPFQFINSSTLLINSMLLSAKIDTISFYLITLVHISKYEIQVFTLEPYWEGYGLKEMTKLDKNCSEKVFKDAIMKYDSPKVILSFDELSTKRKFHDKSKKVMVLSNHYSNYTLQSLKIITVDLFDISKVPKPKYEFLNVQKETILDIVKMTNFSAKQEEIFEAICKWAEHNCPNDIVNKNEFLKNQLSDVMPFVDFSSMDFDFLNSFVVKKGFLFPSFDALSEALCKAAAMKKRAKEERLKIVPKRKRIQITNQQGYKAFADICDPAVIDVIEKIAQGHYGQVKTGTSEYIKWHANLGYQASADAKFFLGKDASGNLCMKKLNPTGRQCCLVGSTGYYSRACIVCDPNKNAGIQIIAPVFESSPGHFNLDNGCKIEFV